MPIRLLAFFLLLVSLGVAPGWAASPASSDAARIDRFEVTPRDRITPGTRLTFTVEGTPHARTTVRLSGLDRRFSLKETTSGVYKGGYTIRNQDRFSARTTMHAVLQAGGQRAVASQPLFSEAALRGDAPTPLPIVVDTPPARFGRKNVLLTIDRFISPPAGKIEPGVELRYLLDGTPGAKASFQIEGVTRDIPMHESSRGRYEGRYTVRQADRFTRNFNVTALLQYKGQIARTRLSQSTQGERRATRGDNNAPLMRNFSPQEGEIVSGNLVLISGSFDDPGGVGVDPRNVQIWIDGIDATRSATITSHTFNYRADLQPGRHPVEVTVRDLAGNTMRQAWTFMVAEPAQPNALPLAILNPPENAPVTGPVEIRGRTAPDTQIDVQVVANASGMTQSIFEQALTSDTSGDFSFSFSPPTTPPGTRYEVIVNAVRGDMRRRLRLNLLQR